MADGLGHAAVSENSRVRPVAKFFFQRDKKFFLKGVTYGPFKPDAKGNYLGQPEQVDAADVARVCDHLERCFPHRCRALGPDGVREAVDHGIARAAAYGIRSERDVCKYVDLMFVFGRDFDLPAEQPWAAKILATAGARRPGALIDALLDRAMHKMHRAGGIQPRPPAGER